ncbi:NAD-P-binding protein [Mycena crocata]|nr:NAD-P-binding protein [Mycena crocata]
MLNVNNIVGMDEDFPGATYRTNVYPLIDPSPHYTAQSFAGKVVFITGASRGIGAETAQQYARAGASLALAARNLDVLDAMKTRIVEETPSAHVLTFALDVVHTKDVERAVVETIAQFGRIDILIANAGQAGEWTRPMLDKDPDEWWSLVEMNIRGTFNSVYFTLPHLLKTDGCMVVVGSKSAQLRIPFASDYGVAKHALGRFIEQVHLEYPTIKMFLLHPGAIPTETGRGTKVPPETAPLSDTVALPAATMLHLTAGKADWLDGRYVSANWDLGEIEEKWKAKILEKGGLVNKLYIPA